MKMAEEWLRLLGPEFEKKYMVNLGKFLNQEYQQTTVYPSRQNIFRALEMTDFSDTKLVVVGQDPYHGPGQANGLAFAVNPGIKVPPSLRNIFKEIKEENLGQPVNSSLLGWAKQGVLLLNTVLTVEAGQANSHKMMGWERFTDQIIQLLGIRDDPLVFLLWGRPARNKKSLIANQEHLVLETSHPSPLSAYNGFFGCYHFTEANNFLLKVGRQPISWQNSGE